MPKLVQPTGEVEELYPLFELSDPALQPNLAGDPWNTDPDKEVCRMVGRDVVSPGTMQPDRGRRPVSISNRVSTPPNFVAIEPSGLYGNQVIRHADLYQNDYTGTSTTLRNDIARAWAGAASGYGWPAEVVGGVIVKNEDERNGPAEYAIITAISTDAQANDTITFAPPFVNAWDSKDKFNVQRVASYDKRGIWMMDGRRFRHLNDSTMAIYLDLSSDTYLGEVWRACQIARDRVLFVNPKYPPRMIQLMQSGTFLNSDNLAWHLPGLFPPGAPAVTELVAPGRVDRGVYAQQIGYITLDDQPALSPTRMCGIRVRAVNLERGSESEFVQVSNKLYPLTIGPQVADRSLLSLGFTFSDGEISGGTTFTSTHLAYRCYQFKAGDKLVLTSPAAVAGTYLIDSGPTALTQVPANTIGGPDDYPVIYASDSDTLTLTDMLADATGVVGYVQTREDDLVRARIFITIPNKRFLVPYDRRWTHLEVWRTLADNSDYYLERRIEISKDSPELGHDPYAIADGDYAFILSGKPDLKRAPGELSDDQLIAQPIMLPGDLGGGRLPPVCKFAVNLGGCILCGGAATASPTWPMDVAGIDFADGGSATPVAGHRRITATGAFVQYVFAAGDQMVITAPLAQAGTYDVYARVSDDDLDIVANFTNVGSGLDGYLVRRQYVPWPTIKNDEEFMYSRPDKFAPESFMASIIRVSQVGDRLRGLVYVSGYAAAIMESGVHLFSNDAGTIRVETIATTAAGTPWEDSIVVLDDKVIWAHPEGPKVMSTSPDADVDGKHARLQWMDPQHRMRVWFSEARRLGYTVDAGVDSLNQTVRFRRSDGENLFESLQYSYKTGLWTELEGDSGLRFVRARAAADADDPQERLYSVTTEAGVFEENNPDTDFPYSGKTVQDTLDSGYSVTETSITRTGAFSTDMVGAMLRLRSPGTDRDAAQRVIRTASANTITFDAVTGLSDAAPRIEIYCDGVGVGLATVEVNATYILCSDNLGGINSFALALYTADTLAADINLLPNGWHANVVSGGALAATGIPVFPAAVCLGAGNTQTVGRSGDYYTDEFLIEAVRFLLKSAPLLQGPARDMTKTLYDLRVRAQLGERTAGAASPGKRLILRTYRNFGTQPEDEQSDITIYDDENDVAYADEDRVSSVTGQGSSLQVEIEHLETRSDFKLSSAAVVLREESNLISDQSSSA